MQDVARMEQAMLELADEIERWAPDGSVHRICHMQTMEIAERIRTEGRKRREVSQ